MRLPPWAASTLPVCLTAACTTVLGIDGDYTTSPVSADASAGAPSSGGGVPDGGESGSGGAAGATAGGAGGVGLEGGAGQLPTGGTSGTGSGGLPDAGGAGGVSIPPEAGPPPCESGTKRCVIDQVSQCVMPDPSVGCDLSDCTSCAAAPQNGFGVCSGDACDFACRPGFMKMGDACEPEVTGSGGSGGSGAGGTGGNGDECALSIECQPCGPFPGCCFHGITTPNRCGCLYVAWCQPF
jgi:hypothetical protein